MFFFFSFRQNVSKPGHRRTDSTHSSNESEYTYNSEYAELEEGSRAAEVRALAASELSKKKKKKQEALESPVGQDRSIPHAVVFFFSRTQDVTRGIDTSLTLKLQKRLTELEQEKQSLRDELENKEEQFQRARARVLGSPPPDAGCREPCQMFF